MVRHVWPDALGEWWMPRRQVVAVLWPWISDDAERRKRDGAHFDGELTAHLTAGQWLAAREHAAQLDDVAARSTSSAQPLAPLLVWRVAGSEGWRVSRRVAAALDRTIDKAVAALQRDPDRLAGAGVTVSELAEHRTAVQWLANRQRALEAGDDLEPALPELADVVDGWCDAEETARILGVSARTIRRWAKAGILTSVLEEGRARGQRFPRAEVENLARRRPSSGAA